jgi:hypothetical protein
MATAELPNGVDVPKQIIKDAIRSAICIDDKYCAPYESHEDGLNFEEPKKLYYSFRKHGHCDLDVYHFENKKEWKKHKYLTHNKDLMVLDWELEQESVPKYAATLDILDYVVSGSIIPFVVIYTKTPDLGVVSEILIERFNKFDSTHYKDLIDTLEEEFNELSENSDEIERFIDGNIALFHDYIKTFTKREEILSRFISELHTFLDLKGQEKKCLRSFKASSKKLFDTASDSEAMLTASNVVLSRERKKVSGEYNTSRVEINQLCYSINGVIIIILHKIGEKDGVSPENLFDTFSKAIRNSPYSVINLIALEIKDKLREDFSVIGTKFNTVNEEAFLYHAENYYSEEDTPNFKLIPFKNFVVRSWIHELLQHSLDIELRSFQLIEPMLPKVVNKNPDLYHSLVTYASLVSTVKLKNRKNWKLGFGDLFKSKETYFLCITPHCDCFEPKKINHQFYFIKGDSIKLESGLKKAEQGYFSFFMEENRPVVVNWDCKPFTAYIPDEINILSSKKFNYAGESYDLSYVCSIKENYTQRIANNSFGYGYRVGIDLPSLRK